MARRQFRICLVGFGHAARAFLRLLIDKRDELDRDYGCEILITAISARSKGSILSDGGIDLQKLLDDYDVSGRIHMTGNESHPSSKEESSINRTKDSTIGQKVDPTLSMIENCNAEILMELSTLSIMDGQPAIGYIEKAFKKGLHVITANKGPIAWDYQRLRSMAESRGLLFLYETTVMDGTPIFNLVRETLHGCKVLSFKGILNSTTNFILTEMESGLSFNEAVLEAQRRGFAEADPSMDIDGWDAAAKTAAIANVLLDGAIKPTDIERTGIAAITPQDIRKARDEHKRIKLLCEACIVDGIVTGKVHPVRIPDTELYSTIDATSSILSITTDLMGEISIVEKNPEIEQTAYGIYSDLLTLIKKVSG